MKRKLQSLILVIGLALLLEGCNQIDTQSSQFKPIEELLGKNDFGINQGMLTFKSRDAFDAFVKDFSLKSDSEKDQWEKTNNFRSLETIHTEIIAREEVFLNEMSIKYKGDESITRKHIGYTPEAQNLIDNGLLVINEFETLDLNIPVHFYGRLLNADGLLRIGNEIHVPKMDFIMIIMDGDFTKANKAKSYKPGDPVEKGLQIARVEHVTKFSSTPNSRTQFTTSCTNTSGSYRLIVYDEYTGIIYDGQGFPCLNAYASYDVKLRSLKKILGSWQNHNTGEWSLRSTMTADHYGNCSSSSTFIRNIVTYSNYSFTPPFGNTWVQYLFQNYHLGPCESGGLNSCSDGLSPTGSIYFPVRQHNATGKNGTSCYVGQ